MNTIKKNANILNVFLSTIKKGCKHFNGTCEPAVDVGRESTTCRSDSADLFS